MLLHQRIGALIPLRPRIVVPEHRRGLLRFLANAERQIAFRQAFERFGRVAGRLIFVDHLAEADRGRKPLAATLVETADLHFLTAKVVVDQVDLQPRIGRVTRIRVTADDVVHRGQRLAGDLLVARHVADLLVIIERDQVIGVGRVLVARVDRQEALRRVDRLLVIARHVIAERAHQLRPACPGRIGMLALDFVEQDGSDTVLPPVEPVLRRRVQRIDVTRDIGRVALLAVSGTASGEDDCGERSGGRGATERGTHGAAS